MTKGMWLSSLLVVALVASVGIADYYPPDWPEGCGWVELLECNVITDGPEAGNFEYIYDVYGGNYTWFRNIDLYFDATQVVNVWNGNELKQNWTAEAAGNPRPFYGGFIDPEQYPSYWEDTNGDFIADAWVLPTAAPNVDWAMDNQWHPGDEYLTGDQNFHLWNQGVADETGVHWTNTNLVLMGSPGVGTGWFSEGLTNTFRIVAPGEPTEIQFSVFHFNAQTYYGTVLGPGWGPILFPGDFDADADIDADDIDLLCANMTGPGVPPSDPMYDLDGDYDVDSDDMDMLIHDLVETTVGVGSEYGDFNLDGAVDYTDEAILLSNFGQTDLGWWHGNANCDNVIDRLDWEIWHTYVPEPATMSLLALGACLPLFRRKRR